MSQFGQTLFGGGRLMRLCLTMAVLIFAITMPLLMDNWTLKRGLLMAGLELPCAAMLGGFWLPPRWSHRSFRLLTALIFLAYAAYLVDEFYHSKHLFHFTGHRHGASPFGALMGFICIGLPCLWYTVFGRFTYHPTPPDSEAIEEEETEITETTEAGDEGGTK